MTSASDIIRLRCLLGVLSLSVSAFFCEFFLKFFAKVVCDAEKFSIFALSNH